MAFVSTEKPVTISDAPSWVRNKLSKNAVYLRLVVMFQQKKLRRVVFPNFFLYFSKFIARLRNF